MQRQRKSLLSVKFVASAELPTQWGQFTLHGFEDDSTGKEHVALVCGDVTGDEPVFVQNS